MISEKSTGELKETDDYSVLFPNDDIDRVYIKRNNSVRKLCNIEISENTAIQVLEG